MITEQDKEKLNVQKIKDGIAVCEDVLAKAEKYERLVENKDWIAHLEDVKVVAALHEKEIKMGEAMILDAPETGYLKLENGKQVYVSSRKDWMDFIIRHEIQRSESVKWSLETERILKEAAFFRERLPILKKQLADLQDAARTNGVS